MLCDSQNIKWCSLTSSIIHGKSRVHFSKVTIDVDRGWTISFIQFEKQSEYIASVRKYRRMWANFDNRNSCIQILINIHFIFIIHILLGNGVYWRGMIIRDGFIKKWRLLERRCIREWRLLKRSVY